MRQNKLIYPLLLLLAVFVNLMGINSGFFTDDPGLYGSIAKQMIYQHSFFNLYSYGRDWLDKPHLPFWFIFFSFKVFGIHTWAYKLPALLCFLLSLLYTWLFAKKYYGKETAIIAVLIISTSLHIMMSNTDVRAEPYLMAFITGSIYHISKLQARFSIKHLLLAALLIAFAIMTKGIFVLVAIGGSLLAQLLITMQYREFIRWRWLLLIVLTVLFTAPELYALYTQFDLHPEKTVFGRQGVSGIKWFLWDSQFGRFVNSGPIKRTSGDVFFFVHTLLWAFAPWCLVFFYAIFKSIKNIVKGIPQAEYYTLGGSLLLWLLFSLSGFQLPFYTNILFPLFAIITARFLFSALNRAEQLFTQWALGLYIVLLPLVVLILFFLLKPDNWPVLIVGVGALLLLIIMINTSPGSAVKKALMMACAVMLFVNFFLNAVFYPLIIASKGQIKAAEYAKQPAFSGYHIYSVKDQNCIFQFYCDGPVSVFPLAQLAAAKSTPNSLLYVSQETMDQINAQHIAVKVIQTFKDYPQENISLAFINHKTRSSTLENVYLITKP